MTFGKPLVKFLGRVCSYYKVCFDPASGGEMIRQEYENFMKPDDSMDMAS